MKCSEGHFHSFDGRRLFYRYYAHESSRDVLVILHGHGEHSGRYEKFSRILEDQNLSLAVFDFRGHGRSEGPEVFIRDFEEYVEDVTAFIALLEEEHGLGSQFFLLGHSMGGLTAAHWVMRHPERIRALILSSPCLGLRLPEFLIQLNRLVYRIYPNFLYGNPVYPPHLTHNPEEVRQYKADPYIKRKISASLLIQCMKAMDQLAQVPIFEFPFPVFILAAGLEKVVDFGRMESFYKKITAPAKKIEVFENFYHEIFNELGQEKAFEALKNCIEETRRKNF